MSLTSGTGTGTETGTGTGTETGTETGTDTGTGTGWDESLMGAWSATMPAAGVSGEKAWAEPTDEPAMSEGEFFTDDAWAEPTAGPEMIELPAVEPVEPVEADEEVVEEEGSPEEDLRVVAAEVEERPEDDVLEGDDAIEDLDDTDNIESQVEVREFDSIEVTHPIVVEKRKIEADSPPFSEVDEPLVKADIEVEEEAAAVEAEPVEIAPTVAGEGPSDTDTGDERRHELSHGVPLPTMTLAKLALQQDDRPLAMATLESLIERDPTNTEAHAMLGELSAQDETVANEKLRAERATTKIVALQGWLDAVRLAAERRVP